MLQNLQYCGITGSISALLFFLLYMKDIMSSTNFLYKLFSLIFLFLAVGFVAQLPGSIAQATDNETMAAFTSE